MSWGAASDGAGGRKDQPVGEDARRREKRGTVAIPIPGTAVHTHKWRWGIPSVGRGEWWCVGSGVCVFWGLWGYHMLGRKQRFFFSASVTRHLAFLPDLLT